MRAKKWTALGAVLATATAASLVFGEAPTPCYEEYWAIGLAQQQVSFDEFRKLQADAPCATAGRASIRNARAEERLGRKGRP